MTSLTNLRSLNLNHLPILREVLRQQSITKAAGLLNLTQPAVSNVIKTLRGHFNDDLVTRKGSGMHRTAKGEELLAFLETALTHIEAAIQGKKFHPGSTRGPIRIATVDNVISTYAAPMCRILALEAPELEIQFVVATRNLASDLKLGKVDIAITSTEFMDSPAIPETLRKELRTHPLQTERLVCIGRRDDRHQGTALSLETYLSRPHASYVVDPDHPHTVERHYITDSKLERPTRISTSSNQSLPAIVAHSDCLAIVPMTLAKLAVRQYSLQIFKPPMELADIKWVVVWHERIAAMPLMQWALDAILRCWKEDGLSSQGTPGA